MKYCPGGIKPRSPAVVPLLVIHAQLIPAIGTIRMRCVTSPNVSLRSVGRECRFLSRLAELQRNRWSLFRRYGGQVRTKIARLNVRVGNRQRIFATCLTGATAAESSPLRNRIISDFIARQNRRRADVI